MFQAHADSIDITPSLPIPLSGFGARKDAYTRIADPLEINAVCIESVTGRVVFLSFDTLFVGETVRTELEKVAAQFDIQPSQLVLAASHTHFAPMLDDTKPALGNVDSAYQEMVLERASELLRRVLSGKGEACRLRYRNGSLAHSVHRRKFGVKVTKRGVRREWMMAPNYDVPTDESFYVVSVEDKVGKVCAVLWSTASHPVSFPFRTHVSADYPGFVRRAFRRAYHRHDVPVVFLQGCCGDVRPREEGQFSLRQRLHRVINGTAFGSFRPEHYFAWADSMAQRVVGSLKAPARTIQGDIKANRWEIPWKDLGEGNFPETPCSTQVVQFGCELAIAGISAEPVGAYGELMQSSLPHSVVIPVGYLDHVFGYLPTTEMLEQGGYEPDGSKAGMNFFGNFKPGLEQAFTTTLSTIVDKSWQQAA